MKTRVITPEAMDQPLPPYELNRALQALGRMHRYSFSSRMIARQIVQWAKRKNRNEISLLDVGCGGGELTVAVQNRCTQAGLITKVVGQDINPTTAALAQKKYAAVASFFCSPATQIVGTYDVIMSSLFLHHLTESDTVEFLHTMVGASRGMILAYDLRRSIAGLGIAWAGSHLLSRSSVVRDDAIRSVRAAYTPDELYAIAKSAKLQDFHINLMPFQRMMLTAEV